MRAVQKPCLICRRKFTRDKFHPYQKVCLGDDCKREYKKKLLKKWRRDHPDYFKGSNRLLEKDTREACRRWRKNNPDYYRNYRLKKLKIKNVKLIKDNCQQQKLAQGA